MSNFWGSVQGWVPSENSKGGWLRNHDNSFHACAFIIRQNNPIYASIIVLFRLIIKKRIFFFEENVVIDFFRHAPSPTGWVPSENSKGGWLRNHDNSFHACAFIIRQNNPIYASIIVLFRLIIKKRIFFFEENVVISCTYDYFVVPLRGNRNRNEKDVVGCKV